MADANLENAAAFLFSRLFFTIEELALKNHAYQQVLAQCHLSDSDEQLAQALRSLRTSDIAAHNTQIRLRAVQAVRDQNFDELIGLAGEISGTTRPMTEGFGNAR